MKLSVTENNRVSFQFVLSRRCLVYLRLKVNQNREKKAGRRLIMDVTYVLQRGVGVWTGRSLAAGSKLGVEASR
jgi:hypothetical protein